MVAKWKGASFMLPQTQFVFDGPLFPDAPSDLYAALGSQGQLINVVPSQNLIVVRMGYSPEGIGGLVSGAFNNEIWKRLNAVLCTTVSIEDEFSQTTELTIYPNPSNSFIWFKNSTYKYFKINSIAGKTAMEGPIEKGLQKLDVSHLEKGVYLISFGNPDKINTQRLIIN